MPLYELRTYTLQVGKMAEAIELYKTLAWPALERLSDGRLVGYFTGDIGAMNQIIHIWRFEDDADRRAFWASVYGDGPFMEFAAKFRPLLLSQHNKLMFNAPWGPVP
ncbi:MAG: NIPSNAP family protein [Pseudomonadota bacterium]